MLRGIHKLCEKGNWDDAIYDLRVDETARNAASIPGGWGEWTPLHLACKRNAPLELIQELVKAAPIAAETFDLKDRLPIHYAVEQGASFEILNALVQACPESLNGVDNSGHTPLHLGFLLNSESGKDNVRPFPSVDEVELLSDEEGTVAATADEAGNLPIHLAVNNIDRCSLDVLLTLICVDAITLDKKNKDGLTPLHLALLNCAEKPISLDIVKALIGAAEDGEEKDEQEIEVLKIADNNGRLPLHLACLNFEHVPLDVLKELLRGFGGAARISMSDGSLPLDILEGLRHTVTRPQDILDFNEKSDLIFAHHPNIEQYRNEPSRLGRISNRIKTELVANKCLGDESRMIWTWMCMLSEDEDKDKMHFITISQTLNSVRDDSLKRSLASTETVTEDGRILPLNTCVPDRVAVLLKRCLLFADRYELLKHDVEQDETSCKVKAFDWEDSSDQRKVVIKFMTDRNEFIQETSLRTKFQSSTFPAVIPMIENFDVGRLGTDAETTSDAKYEYDISKGENPGGVDLSQYPCAIVLEECGQTLSNMLSERFTGASADDISQLGKDIAYALRRLHSSGMSHGGISDSSFVQLGSKGLVFESLRSASVMQEMDSSDEWYTGEASCIRTGFLPPEMFVKLDDNDMKLYMGYWKTVAGDADIKMLLKCDDTRRSIAVRVDSFLNGSGEFSDLWTRIASNADLWEKIKPRKVGNSYYAIRSFHRDPASGKPLFACKLPYKLHKANARQDTWTLGLLLYQVISGEVMFRTTPFGDIEDDTIFSSLCNWNIDGRFEQERLAKVCNPVARDLLRMLLGDSSGCSKMDQVCQHAFFGSNEGESILQCLRILKRDKKVRMQQEAMAEKEDRLRRRTTELASIPADAHHKLERSTWTQWDEHESEAAVPTTFILLPYKLQVDEKFKRHTMSSDDKKKALGYGLAIADFVHYTNFSSCVAKRYGKDIATDCCSTKLWEYSELNKSTLSVTESNLLSICRGILTRVKNAELVLSDIIKTILPDVDNISEAKKLVRDAIESIVDVEICRDITKKAAVVEKAVQSLFNVANDSSSQLTTTEQIVSEQLQKLTGKDTSLEEDNKKKTDVEMTLFRLVKDFSENPLAASRRLLMKKIEDVLNFFSPKPTAGAHLYLIDDMTGSPVTSSVWPLKIFLSPDILRILLPGMYLSVKSFCASGMADGLTSVLGLSQGGENMAHNWTSSTKWSVGGFNPDSTENELSSILAATGSNKAIGTKRQQLEQLQSFILSKDPHESFSGLARILYPDNRVLWTLRDDYKEEEKKSMEAHPSRCSMLSTKKKIACAKPAQQAPVQSKIVLENSPEVVARDESFSSALRQTETTTTTVTDKKQERSAEMEIPVAQVKAQRNLVDEQQRDEITTDDDLTVSTLNSMLSNPAAAYHSLPPPPPKPSHDDGKVTKLVISAHNTPLRAREERINEKRSGLHDDVTPKAATNRTLSSSSSVSQQRKRTPTPVRSHRKPPSDSPLRGRSHNSENHRNRGNTTRSSPGVGLYKKAMAKSNISTPVGSVSLARKNMFSDDSDDVSVISMTSTSTRRNLRRFRSAKKG